MSDNVSVKRPDAPAFTAIVRRWRTPSPLSGVPLPVSSAAPVKEPSESGTPSPALKRDEPGLAASRKLASCVWMVRLAALYWSL